MFRACAGGRGGGCIVTQVPAACRCPQRSRTHNPVFLQQVVELLLLSAYIPNSSSLGYLRALFSPDLKKGEGCGHRWGQGGRTYRARASAPPLHPRPPPPDYLSAKSRAHSLDRALSVSASRGSPLVPHTCGPDSRASGLKAKSVPG